ncbi:DSBA oxidoreductase [Rhizodiscina lignyota]|uniref:DSBA oxidoreductase n=1 Tax=Rhizodiscina lignyota TaxID=1504668 RepID=A0A9P4MCL8_9PEZI|nr:DSBA oxidoreductase [Rhizodiscina lignyota]
MHFVIEVVSDTVCPWCYIGSRQLTRAISEYKRLHPERNDTFSVSWKPFYLNPNAQQGVSADKRASYVKRHGEAGAEAIFDRIAKAGQAPGVGINFKFGGRTGSSRDSHCLIHHAGLKSSDVQTRLVNALFRAYFEEEKDISQQETLLEAAQRAGVDEIDARMWLTDQAEGTKVDLQAAYAREKAINGVPHFTLNGRFEITGAQESLAFVRLFERLVKLEERAKV